MIHADVVWAFVLGACAISILRAVARVDRGSARGGKPTKPRVREFLGGPDFREFRDGEFVCRADDDNYRRASVDDRHHNARGHHGGSLPPRPDGVPTVSPRSAVPPPRPAQ